MGFDWLLRIVPLRLKEKHGSNEIDVKNKRLIDYSVSFNGG